MSAYDDLMNKPQGKLTTLESTIVNLMAPSRAVDCAEELAALRKALEEAREILESVEAANGENSLSAYKWQMKYGAL